MTSLQSMIDGSPRMKALSDYLRADAHDSDRKWAAYVALAPDLAGFLNPKRGPTVVSSSSPTSALAISTTTSAAASVFAETSSRVPADVPSDSPSATVQATLVSQGTTPDAAYVDASLDSVTTDALQEITLSAAVTDFTVVFPERIVDLGSGQPDLDVSTGANISEVLGLTTDTTVDLTSAPIPCATSVVLVAKHNPATTAVPASIATAPAICSTNCAPQALAATSATPPTTTSAVPRAASLALVSNSDRPIPATVAISTDFVHGNNAGASGDSYCIFPSRDVASHVAFFLSVMADALVDHCRPSCTAVLSGGSALPTDAVSSPGACARLWMEPVPPRPPDLRRLPPANCSGVLSIAINSMGHKEHNSVQNEDISSVPHVLALPYLPLLHWDEKHVWPPPLSLNSLVLQMQFLPYSHLVYKMQFRGCILLYQYTSDTMLQEGFVYKQAISSALLLDTLQVRRITASAITKMKSSYVHQEESICNFEFTQFLEMQGTANLPEHFHWQIAWSDELPVRDSLQAVALYWSAYHPLQYYVVLGSKLLLLWPASTQEPWFSCLIAMVAGKVAFPLLITGSPNEVQRPQRFLLIFACLYATDSLPWDVAWPFRIPRDPVGLLVWQLCRFLQDWKWQYVLHNCVPAMLLSPIDWTVAMQPWGDASGLYCAGILFSATGSTVVDIVRSSHILQILHAYCPARHSEIVIVVTSATHYGFELLPSKFQLRIAWSLSDGISDSSLAVNLGQCLMVPWDPGD